MIWIVTCANVKIIRKERIVNVSIIVYHIRAKMGLRARIHQPVMIVNAATDIAARIAKFRLRIVRRFCVKVTTVKIRSIALCCANIIAITILIVIRKKVCFFGNSKLLQIN